MAWVKWDVLLASHRDGGLNIGSLRGKNLALLGKWWWRFKKEGGSLWVRIIKSIYGSSGGIGNIRGLGGGFGGGGVWCNIIKIGEEMGGLGIDFSTSFVGMVGNGRDIGFWVDKWVGDTRLCDRFPRLYHLDSRKEDRVAEKGRWVDNEWRWEWVWVRDLRGRVMGEYNELLGILQNVVVSKDCSDRWRWVLQDDGNFTVKALSRVVEDKILRVESGALVTLWNSWVPKKVNIFIWRLLKGRLPVREELDRRGIDLDSLLCPCCNNAVESCNHSFVFCNFAMSIWEKVFNWWRVGNVNVFSIGELFSSCGNVVIPNRVIRLWQAVIWTSGYYIWKARNERVFKGKVTSINKLFQDIQLKSYEWIGRRAKRKCVIEWQQWFRDPIKCGVLQ